MNLAPSDTIPKLPTNVRIDWNSDELTGQLTGSPRNASIEKGNAVLETIESVLLSLMQEMDRNNWKNGMNVNQDKTK